MAIYHCCSCTCPEKRRDAAIAKAALDYHKKTCRFESAYCKRCRELERRLEDADIEKMFEKAEKAK